MAPDRPLPRDLTVRVARSALLAACAAAVLSACAPVTVAEAERSCLADVQASRAPRSSVSLGVASDGHSVRPVAGVQLSVSSDAFDGRDPADRFNACVMRRSGAMPTRPLSSQSGWTG